MAAMSIIPCTTKRRRCDSSFIENITDDILREILIRLPNAKNVIRCSVVCKCWSSLVFDSKFPHLFSYHHRHDPPAPLSLLLRKCIPPGMNTMTQYERRRVNFDLKFHRILLNQETLSLTHNSLSFFRWNDMVIRSCCADLLLVSRLNKDCDTSFSFCICNAITKKWCALPEPPRPITRIIKCGLVCHRDSEGLCCYNVVLLFNVNQSYLKLQHERQLWVSVFSSETGQWSPQALLTPPPPSRRWQVVDGPSYTFNDLVPCSKGVVYCLEGYSFECEWVMAFGPLVDVAPDGRIGCRLIKLPFRTNFASVRLGAYKGRLQVARMSYSKDDFVLKVWELNCESCWSLVVNASSELKVGTRFLRVLSLHPTNRNIVFLLMERHILQYDMSCGKVVQVGSLPQRVERLCPEDELTAYTLHSPSPWPTPIPKSNIL